MQEITKEYLISEFWRWVNNHNGDIPKRGDMKSREGYPNVKVYTDFLGVTDRQWQPVLDFIGVKRPKLTPKRREYKYDNYTKDDFINIVKLRTTEIGHTPKQEDFGKKHNLPSASCIVDKLGLYKWNEVLKLCNVGEAKERYYDEDKVLNDLKQYIINIGYVPNHSQMKRVKYKPAMSWFADKFGSYENALNLIGYTTVTTDEDLIQILKDFYNKNGRSPYTSDMKNSNGLPSTEMYYGRFNTNSWNEVLKIAELDFVCKDYDKEYGLNFGIEKLIEFYNILGRLPKSEDFKVHNWIPSIHYYNDKYGGLINSLYKAGLISKPLSNKERINISIQTLIDLSNELKRCPTVDEFDSINHNGFQRRELERKLGIKYNKICKKYLKYKVNIDMDITKEEIYNAILELCNELEKPPMFKDLKQFGCMYSYSLIQGKCKCTYNELIRDLGFTPTGTDTSKRSEEQMLSDFYEYFLELGRIPSCDEINANNANMASHPTYIAYFGSTENVCKLLDIDCSLYYTGQFGTGRVCFDKNGSLCRSVTEMNISNYLIDNNIIFDKETKYKDIIPVKNNRRLDWSIYTNKCVYYVEYFGMYSRNSNSKITKKYNKKTKEKIKSLHRFGYYDNSIFIFPYDIKNKTLDEIFKDVLSE